MGASKIPLYAYVDETGNTGHNLFDVAQPDFYTAALITKGDFDLAFARPTEAIANKLGVRSLHGKELGLVRLEVSRRGYPSAPACSEGKIFRLPRRKEILACY